MRDKAQEYFTKKEGHSMPPFKVRNRANKLLTDFVLSGGFDIPELDDEETGEK